MEEQREASPAPRGQTVRLIPAYFAAELMGTFLLVLIGDGALAGYVLDGKPVDPFNVCMAFGVGAMIASYVSAKVSGAYLNPAATLASALAGRLRWPLVPVYMAGQYLGGFLAALVLFLNYSEAIEALDGGARSANGANHSTGLVFATYPAPFVSLWGSLADQIAGTAVLLFSLTAVGDRLNLGLEERFQPPMVALVVGFTCFAFNVNCGAIFNPARDLAPRLLTALVGYPGVWAPLGGAYWLLAGVAGPHIGAIVGVFGYKYLIGASLAAAERHKRLAGGHAAPEPDELDMAGVTKAGRLAFGRPHQQHHHLQPRYRPTEPGSDANNNAGPEAQRRPEVADYGAAVLR